MQAKRLLVRHTTVYRYRRPVSFHEHVVRCRPRDSHDQRVIDARMLVTPAARIRQAHDVFSNSLAIVQFQEPSDELRFECEAVVDKFPDDEDLAAAIDPAAQAAPFTYPGDEMPDLMRAIERRFPDPDRLVDQWARRFFGDYERRDTLELLNEMNCAVKREFDYTVRHEEGVMRPTELMDAGVGSCRDYSLFLMEALRSIGFATRFVSGYLYDPSVDGFGDATVGGGSTHAWLAAYVPGAGWIELDPTNGQFGNENLVRVAVARDPDQAAPLHGAYVGDPSDFDHLHVEVVVRRQMEPGDAIHPNRPDAAQVG